jgi:hypothetical protein
MLCLVFLVHIIWYKNTCKHKKKELALKVYQSFPLKKSLEDLWSGGLCGLLLEAEQLNDL